MGGYCVRHGGKANHLAISVFSDCPMCRATAEVAGKQARIAEPEKQAERYEAALRKITWLTVVSHDLPAAQKIARDALEGE